jgi:hypothetical protein
MNQKNLAYFKICIKNENEKFEEIYIVIEPTVFYLPDNLVLKILEVNKCLIKFNLSTIDNKLDKTMIINLCDCDYYKQEIVNQCKKILFSIKLCSIKTLKPLKYKCNHNNYL